MSAAARKSRSPIVDSTLLTKGSVVGCTAVPSKDDTNLDAGIALTTINNFDHQYVKFEDIDGTGPLSYRYWKDVYLVIGWNDPKYQSIYPPMKQGDLIFALFQNPGGDWTTVYWKARIKKMPCRSTKNLMVIDYLDGTNDYINITVDPTASIKAVGCNITVPTVIRRSCTEGSIPHQKAMEKYKKVQAAKLRKRSQHKEPSLTPSNQSTPSAEAYVPPSELQNNRNRNISKNDRTRSNSKVSGRPKKATKATAMKTRPRSNGLPELNSMTRSKSNSQSLTPIKRSSNRNHSKKQIRDLSDSEEPVLSKVPPPNRRPPMSTSNGSVSNLNIGVTVGNGTNGDNLNNNALSERRNGNGNGNGNGNTSQSVNGMNGMNRKRTHSAANMESSSTVSSPATKRRRMSQRQTLKKSPTTNPIHSRPSTPSAIPSMPSMVRRASTASTISNVSNLSRLTTPNAPPIGNNEQFEKQQNGSNGLNGNKQQTMSIDKIDKKNRLKIKLKANKSNKNNKSNDTNKSNQHQQHHSNSNSPPKKVKMEMAGNGINGLNDFNRFTRVPPPNISPSRVTPDKPLIATTPSAPSRPTASAGRDGRPSLRNREQNKRRISPMRNREKNTKSSSDAIGPPLAMRSETKLGAPPPMPLHLKNKAIPKRERSRTPTPTPKVPLSHSLSERMSPRRRMQKQRPQIQRTQSQYNPNMAKGRKTKFRKLWGEYQVELPPLGEDTETTKLFGDSGYLDDIAKELETLKDAQKKETESGSEGFISGFGVRHKWSAPQEIGEITVGPYVVEMDIMQEE